MIFPALVRLVILTAEHVYSANPGNGFNAQGVISHNKCVLHITIDTKRCVCKWNMVFSKQYTSAKRAHKIGYYLVFMTYVGCFSLKSTVSSWIVSYLLVYTLYTPLHYPHAAIAGCDLAGVAPVGAIIKFNNFSNSPSALRCSSYQAQIRWCWKLAIKGFIC